MLIGEFLILNDDECLIYSHGAFANLGKLHPPLTELLDFNTGIVVYEHKGIPNFSTCLRFFVSKWN